MRRPYMRGVVDLVIRKVTGDDDFLAIGRIYVDGWRSAYKGIMPQGYLDRMDVDEIAAKHRAMARPELVMLDDEGKYIGASVICPSREADKPGWGEVKTMYLLPEYQGRGLGQVFMDAALAELKQMGFAKIYLWTQAKNYRARRFYEKYGFIKGDELNIYTVDGVDLPEYCYKWGEV